MQIDSLAGFFAYQDAMCRDNWEAARSRFELVQRGLVLGWQITIGVNEGEVLKTRQAKPEEEWKPENICLNLLHAAWATLVNATRLALFGANVDALSLTRLALEAAYYADFFKDNPAEASEWDEPFGLTADLQTRRKAVLAFDRKHRIRKSVEEASGVTGLDDFYWQLSTYGSHANPATVHMRLSTPGLDRANLGFASKGYVETPVLVAGHILATLMYVLAVYREGFASYLTSIPGVDDTYDRLLADWNQLRADGPRELSVSR